MAEIGSGVLIPQFALLGTDTFLTSVLFMGFVSELDEQVRIEASVCMAPSVGE